MKQEWPALSWLTREEEKRRVEEEQARELHLNELEEAGLTEETNPFNPFYMCGHHAPSDKLPDEELERYFVWCVCGRDFRKVLWAEEHLTLLELTEFFAYQRTDLYMSTEDIDARGSD